MVRPGIIAGLLVALGAGSATGGPWLRDDGAVFLSFGGTASTPLAAASLEVVSPTIYLEYGLAPDLTVGFDGFLSEGGRSGAGVVFATVPMARILPAANGLLGDGQVASLTAGFGVALIPDAPPEPSIALGLAWGRGLPDGWLTVEASVLAATSGDRFQSKLDLTWGHRFDDGLSGILSAQIGTGRDGSTYANISPSLAHEIRANTTVRVGLSQAVTGSGDTSLLIQTWWQF